MDSTYLDFRYHSYDLRQLRYFMRLPTREVSQASLQLGVTQSALSHHIGQMEARLGVTLFSRSSKGVERPRAATDF